MVAESVQRDRRLALQPRDLAGSLAALSEAASSVAGAASLGDALTVLAEAAAGCVHADAAVIRSLDSTGRCLVVRSVAARSAALVAELEGSRLPLADLPPDVTDDLEALPSPVRRAADRLGATAVLLVPLRVADAPVGSLELVRDGPAFSETERLLARLTAGQASLAVRALQDTSDVGTVQRERALELLADALVSESEEEPAAWVARLAAMATGARSALVWLGNGDSDALELAAHGPGDDADLDALRGQVAAALDARAPANAELAADGEALVATLRLGEPPLGALQLVFPADAAPTERELARVATVAVRAAQSLRSAERARGLAAELDRTRALLAVLGQAIAQLSLAHTLETATAYVAQLLRVDRVAVYLRENERLEAAAAQGLAGPHAVVAQRLLELALGPYRARGVLVIPDAGLERRLARVADAVTESGIEMALAVPLRAQDEVIGLLATYPERGRALLPGETSLLTALGAQLAVAVQNARLHEEAKRLGSELEDVLRAEREAARQLRALYEISGSFAESMSLEPTLEAVARTVVETLDLDAAAIRMVDRRRSALITRAVHVADRSAEEALRTLLMRPMPLSGAAVDLAPTARPVLLDADSAADLGDVRELLAPFLARGSTAAVVPLATKNELLATLNLLTFDSARPITAETVQAARTIAAQAALAIDNARLYQQQKDFAETMQRSLLPQTAPGLEGFDLGHVYESSARMDVGGDVYDFLFLDDGRLAMALGDVTGHGVAAAAEMAMAKFVFRSLAREHPDPAEFLTTANEVFLSEVELGKFITMAYALLDVQRAEIVCASAGHPPPRLVAPDGTVVPLAASGLALGIDAGQAYDETRAPIEPGGSVVLYTDGVVEARCGTELYGTARLDAVLARDRERSAAELARAVIEDCRSFGGGELVDDCAVVVVKRLPA